MWYCWIPKSLVWLDCNPPNGSFVQKTMHLSGRPALKSKENCIIDVKVCPDPYKCLSVKLLEYEDWLSFNPRVKRPPKLDRFWWITKMKEIQYRSSVRIGFHFKPNKPLEGKESTAVFHTKLTFCNLFGCRNNPQLCSCAASARDVSLVYRINYSN